MSGCGSHCAWASERPGRARLKRAALAAVVAALTLAQPATARAYRFGLASSLGGATLRGGHVLWLQAGYPSASAGWLVALGRRVDLGLSATVAYGSPLALGEALVGGGGGAQLRVGLWRGRASGALTFRAAALAYAAFGGAAALLDLGSPALALSFRLRDRLALHVELRAVLGYVTQPGHFLGGFDGRGGLTLGLTERLAFTASLAYGLTLEAKLLPGGARFEALVGLEYRLGGSSAAQRSSPAP